MAEVLSYLSGPLHTVTGRYTNVLRFSSWVLTPVPIYVRHDSPDRPNR